MIEETINPFIPEIHLFHDRGLYGEFCKRELGGYEDLGGNGQTHYADGTAAVLICTPDEGDVPSEFALIAHESYHVLCMHFEYLGVKDYDDEIVAYAIQAISGSICAAHMEWLEKAGKAAV